MCFEPFGIDFNFDGKGDLFEQALTFKLMEDALSEKNESESNNFDYDFSAGLYDDTYEDLNDEDDSDDLSNDWDDEESDDLEEDLTDDLDEALGDWDGEDADEWEAEEPDDLFGDSWDE